MNIALWAVAGLLTIIYLMSGVVKLLVPTERLANFGPSSGWIHDFKPGTVKLIGVAEVLGAIGLMLPALFDIIPVLVPLAALGLALIMTGAVSVRIRRHEPRYALVDLVYLVLIAFVAIGRFGPESVSG